MKSLMRQLLDRLPLAKVVLMSFSFVMDRASLEQLFEEHRGRAYTKKLAFSTVVYLIRDALISRQAAGARPPAGTWSGPRRNSSSRRRWWLSTASWGGCRWRCRGPSCARERPRSPS